MSDLKLEILQVFGLLNLEILQIADGCAHIISSLDARFQAITENIITFFWPIQHILANEGLYLPLQTHCFSANAAPETFASRPRGGRVCSQRRLRLLPEAVASAPRFTDRHRVSAVGMLFS